MHLNLSLIIKQTFWQLLLAWLPEGHDRFEINWKTKVLVYLNSNYGEMCEIDRQIAKNISENWSNKNFDTIFVTVFKCYSKPFMTDFLQI